MQNSAACAILEDTEMSRPTECEQGRFLVSQDQDRGIGTEKLGGLLETAEIRETRCLSTTVVCQVHLWLCSSYTPTLVTTSCSDDALLSASITPPLSFISG